MLSPTGKGSVCCCAESLPSDCQVVSPCVWSDCWNVSVHGRNVSVHRQTPDVAASSSTLKCRKRHYAKRARVDDHSRSASRSGCACDPSQSRHPGRSYIRSDEHRIPSFDRLCRLYATCSCTTSIFDGLTYGRPLPQVTRPGYASRHGRGRRSLAREEGSGDDDSPLRRAGGRESCISLRCLPSAGGRPLIGVAEAVHLELTGSGCAFPS